MYEQFLSRNLELPETCGAETRHGSPCKNAPRLPSLRCSKHGGKTPIKHGKKTKYSLKLRKHDKLLRMEILELQKNLHKQLRKK